MINKITIKNFQGFNVFTCDTITPINVVIGENDSGKTGLLKLLYGVSKSIEEFTLKTATGGGKESFKKILSDKLLSTFQPRKNGLGELVSKGAGEKLSVEVTYWDRERLTLFFGFGDTTTNTITDCSDHIDSFSDKFNTLFLPAKEVLTAFEAIALTRENLFAPGFDDTYYDLIKALRIPTQQGNVIKELTKVNKDLEDLFEGVVVQGTAELPFIFKKGNAEFTMPLTAEGIKKMGILTTLIRNRQIAKNTVLFMDEPETALHPKAVRQLAEMIVSMADAGVQIFLTTHSYFMIKQLTIIAQRKNMDMNCVSLTKEKGQSVQVKIENMKNGLPDNPIIQEAIKMFNEDLNRELGI